MANSDLPSFIFAGDLNATPGSKAAKSLRQEFKNAGPALTQKSWTTEPFTIGPWSYNELKWRLDYVLYRGTIRPKASQLLSPGLSDHLPIIVTFDKRPTK